MFPAAEDAAKVVDKVRKKTHLPRDSQGFIRVQWLENFYETLYASNERDIHIPFTVVFQVVIRRSPPRGCIALAVAVVVSRFAWT
jgi:hypothetical protein